jgi:thiamine kinase-like enzyme
LETRPDEWQKMKHHDLKAKALLIDETLNQCRFHTIVHGDAKLANFCFSESGKKVAAVDFQYVGGGCGMKDVAYFLGSCLSGSESELYEAELLNFYFSELQTAIPFSTEQIDFHQLEVEWRKMYPFACADFTRFLLGWMPTHQKVNSYNLKILADVLARI